MAVIHPAIRVLASQPDLLAEHIAGYGQLVAAQAAEAAFRLRRRAWLVAAQVIFAGVGTGLGGMALLLVAALPLEAMPAPWLLVIVPLAPFGAFAGCWWAARQAPPGLGFEPLREQLAADVALLREAGAS